MKKTYFAPTCQLVKITPMQMLAASTEIDFYEDIYQVDDAESVGSNGFKKSIWI